MSIDVRVERGSGYATQVPADSIVWFEITGHSQVIDLNLFHTGERNEHFGSSVTRPIVGSHVQEGSVLYSNPPFERPIAKIEEIQTIRFDSDDVSKEEGWRDHDLLYGRCSRGFREKFYGYPSDGCQEIIAREIEEYDYSEFDVHDPLNLFMTTRLSPAGELELLPSRCAQGSKVGLRILVPTLVAFSCCPGRSSGAEPGEVRFLWSNVE